MRADAIYRFERKADAKSRYILTGHEGADIPDFPAVYKRTGGKYIEFDENRNPPRKGHRYFKYGFYLGTKDGKHRRFTGVNFTTAEPCRAYGDSKNMGRNDGVLFEFSQDFRTLAVYFFFEQGANAETLFNEWTGSGKKENPPTE